jgi:His/Glu/Gln/Arg/opine family amino acid ABC transporter permease subunit
VSDLLNLLSEHLDGLAGGLWVTLRLVVAAFGIALVVGTVVAALRIAPSQTTRRLGGIYVETFRNIPLLVLLTLAYAGVRRAGLPIDQWTAGVVSLGLYTAAYVAEVLRSGVFAVSKGQREAALSLGLGDRETLRLIVLPQAFRTVIAPLGSITIAMIKNSAIVGASIIALNDILKEARIIQAQTFKTEESFFWAAVGYLLLTGTATVAFRLLERRFAISR